MRSDETKKNIAYFCLITLWFIYFTGGKFINPYYIDWIFPSDTETHWLGWQFFKNQSIFNFPIFKNTDYGLELGSSLVLNDSLSIMAIIFKPFSTLIPFEFQYFGIWTYLCFLLQGFIAMKIFKNYSKDGFAIVLGGLLFAMLPPFLWRLHGHFGLLGQWLILYAFLLYLTLKELNLKSWTVLIIISLLINAYISAMIIGIFIADLIKYKILKKSISLRFLGLSFLKFLISLAVSLFIFGYFMVGKGAGGKGFGKFNANLNSFFDPDQIWSVFFNNLPTPESGYEGFAFPGTGVIIMILIALTTIFISKDKIKFENIRFASPLLLVAFISYFFALSNNITIGTNIIASYEVPNLIVFLTKIFRSSGRFVWIIFYLITIFSLIYIFKSYSKKTLRFLLIIFISIQFIDLSKASQYFSTKLNNPYVYNGRNTKWASPMKDIIWSKIGKNYNKISYVFTSNRPKDYFPIAHFAAKNKMKINTGYFSRVSKSATKIVNTQLEESIINKTIDEDTLYFIYDDNLWQYIIENYNKSDYLIKNINDFKILAVSTK